MAKDKPLLERTKALLTKLHGHFSYQDIADGSEVDREWLSKFARGEIPEPGVNKVQRVHDFLSRAHPG
jgi:hypothetical protein